MPPKKKDKKDEGPPPTEEELLAMAQAEALKVRLRPPARFGAPPRVRFARGPPLRGSDLNHPLKTPPTPALRPLPPLPMAVSVRRPRPTRGRIHEGGKSHLGGARSHLGGARP